MTERNICRETRCKAACCRNLKGYMLPSYLGSYLESFPEAKEVASESEVYEKVYKQEHGVYYFIDPNWVFFSISGDCPNLIENFDCRIHSEEYYPAICKHLIPGSYKCEDAREIFRLRPLDLAAASQVLK